MFTGAQHTQRRREHNYLPQVMAAQATPKFLSHSLAITICAASFADAATLEGRVQYPGRAIPAATLYVRNVESGALQSQTLGRNEAAFSLEVPPGRYWVFVRPREVGLTGLYGAYTRFSACRLQPSNPEDACTDHGLTEVDLTEARRKQVNVDDWFLDDAAAAALDEALGATSTPSDAYELGRPRFSEYRAGPLATTPVTKLVLPAESKGVAFARELQRAAASGPNFAGGFTLVRLTCGEECVQVAVVDLSDGAVLFPTALAQLPQILPCRPDDILVFRDDSRLVELTSVADDSIETNYLLWQPQQRTFASLAKYRRSEERFCGRAPAETAEPAAADDAPPP